MEDRFAISNVGISITNPEDAVDQILKKAVNEDPAYVCVSNVRALYYGNHNSDYCRILNNSFLTVPDGKPIEWLARLAGCKPLQRTSGPNLFTSICQLTENSPHTHFFYGSTPEVIKRMEENLKKKWPELKIVGTVSPPHKPAEELANDDIIKQINSLRPTFVWIGLGAPKQERFIDLVINDITSSILIGIGLVFDYQSGAVKRAPVWMQKIGLEWLYRDIQQPRRLPFLFMQFLYLIREASFILVNRIRKRRD